MSLCALCLLFWKLRILDSGVELELTLENLDLYHSTYPTLTYGFGALREGRIPLWNPWQFFGTPFLALYYAGLFYPPNAIYLVTSVPLGIEISGGLHMLLGAAGMAALARRLRISWPGALVAALTFVWSGWFVLSTNHPRVLAVVAWMPCTVWLLERVLARERGAVALLALGSAAQLLIGDSEHVMHNWLVGALWVLLRIAGAAASDRRDAIVRGACCALALGLGAALAAFQLLPTLELVGLTERGVAGVDLSRALGASAYRWGLLAEQAAALSGWATTGALALVAVLFALGGSRGWPPVLLGAGAALLGAELVMGDALFRLYRLLPFAQYQRHPFKFLDVYSFGQALLAGLAVARLEDWTARPRGALWRDPRWLAALAVALVALVWLRAAELPVAWLAALLFALALYGALAAGRAREAALALLIVVQLASLFASSANRFVRPLRRPEALAARNAIFAAVRARGDQARVYLSPHFGRVPGLTLKQGMLNEVGVANDYEPLALARYADYFGAVSPWRESDGLFHGRYPLVGDTRWRLLDLAGTRFYVVRGDEEAAAKLAAQPLGPDGQGFRALREGEIQIFERPAALPRAWWVGRAREVADGAAALAALCAPDFDPRREIVLERDAAGAQDGALASDADASAASARITSYEPERIEIAVDAPAPGWLVLSDLAYPGWRAEVNGDEAAIARADHLFRAVRVGGGRSTVRFEYRPASLRLGAAISAATALLIAAGTPAAARFATRQEK
jgi:hypothetical protein